MGVMRQFWVFCAVLLLAAPALAGDERSYELPPFRAVKLKSFVDVDISIGQPFRVTAKGKADALDRLELSLEGGALVIDMRTGWGLGGGNDSVTVQIAMPFAEALVLQGSGDLRARNFSGNALVLRGTGDMTVRNIMARDLSLALAGSGDLNVEGRCLVLNATLGGSGDMRANKLRCEMVEAVLAGSGDLRVFAARAAAASIRGSGEIFVHGKPPRLDSRVMGSGEVHYVKD
jgi:hypothetical protein